MSVPIFDYVLVLSLLVGVFTLVPNACCFARVLSFGLEYIPPQDRIFALYTRLYTTFLLGYIVPYVCLG
jgi:hypothetical protein